MKKEIIASGKDINEARENARLALGAGELDDINFEIIDLGSKGIFGIIGVKPAKVKAWMEIPDTEPRRERREVRRPQEPKNQGDAPTREKPAKATGKGNGKAAKTAPKAPEKPAAIPEEELKFTHVDANPGDDRAFDFINTLISDLGLTDIETELLRCEDGTRRVSIKGENASLLIGHHGDTMDALQYLANLATSQKGPNGERDRSRVTVDIEGYRAKREQTLRHLARRMANKALARGSKVTLEPMTPYERRIIHSEVQSIEGVTTQSIGTDSNRRIVIYPEHPTKGGKSARAKAAETEQVEETDDITATVEETTVQETAETVEAETEKTVAPAPADTTDGDTNE